MPDQSVEDAARSRTQPREDEISLVDLWLVLLKQRRLVAIVLALCTVAASVVAFLLPAQYAYITVVEVGSRPPRGPEQGRQMLEQPEDVKTKLDRVYIPAIERGHRDGKRDDGSFYPIRVSIPKGSNLVLLESQGTKTEGHIYLENQRAAVQAIAGEHARLVEEVRSQIQVAKTEAVNGLKNSEEESTLLRAKSKRLKDEEQLISHQIQDLKAMLASTLASRERLVANVKDKDEMKAMAVLMIDNQIGQSQNQLADLKRRLTVDLDNERDNLQQSTAENEGKQREWKERIAAINAQLATVRNTHAVIPPSRSIEPTSMSATLIILLGVLAGAVTAVLSAVAREFSSQIQARGGDLADRAEYTRSLEEPGRRL
jgi:Chain length determinant protein